MDTVIESEVAVMPRVFIPAVPTRYDPIKDGRISSIDLRPAMHFGELTVLVPDIYPITNDNCGDTLAAIRAGLVGMSANDFVLAVGDPILIAAAIAYADDMNGVVKVLRWDRRIQNYHTIEVRL